VGAPFHGWRVVAAAFVAQLVSNGCTFLSFGVFVIPLSEAFETTRGTISAAPGLAMLAMGAVSPFLGRAIDGGPLRGIMLAGVALLSAGLLLLSLATSLWQMALVFCALVAVGAAMCGPLAANALVVNWFVRRRGLALGVAVAGATAASFLMPPLAAFLIDRLGWRGALAGLGVFAAALALPVFFAFVVPRPEDVGQTPDGDPAREAASGGPLPLPETGALLRDPNLWLIALAFAFVFASPVVMHLHLVPWAEDQGLSRQRAAYFFTAMAPFSLLGKIAFGAVADRIDPRRATWIAVSFLIATWCLLLTEPGYPAFLAIGAIYGLGVGAVAPIHGVVVGACFGRGGFGRVMGIGGLAGLPIIALSGPLAGFLYDATQDYELAFSSMAASLVAAALLVAFLRVPAVEPGTAGAGGRAGAGAPAARQPAAPAGRAEAAAPPPPLLE
jgi:predicted MFS family arabinose efflux permease